MGLDTWNRLAPIIEIGIHHEQQHQELILTDIKHVLSFNPLHPTYRERDVVSEESSAAADWIVVSEGMYLTGHDGEGFCYDNEMPRHRHHLESFELCERLVTNAEYLEFVQDGSYGKPTLWLSDGWYAVETGEMAGTTVLDSVGGRMALLHIEWTPRGKPWGAGFVTSASTRQTLLPAGQGHVCPPNRNGR